MGHRVLGVDRQVDDDLLQLPGVGAHRAQVSCEDRAQLDVLTDQALQHPVHVGHDLVEVEDSRGQDLLAAEGEQLTRQVGGAQRRLPGLHGFFATGMVGRQAFQKQVGGAQDGGEQVVEVVRHAARESPDRFHFLRLKELLLEALHVRDVLDQGENPRDPALRVTQWRGRQAGRDRGAVLLPANDLHAV